MWPATSAVLSVPFIIMPWCQPFAAIAAAAAPMPPTREAPARNANTVCRLNRARKRERAEEVDSDGVFMVSPFGVVELDEDCAPRSLAVFVGRVKICEAGGRDGRQGRSSAQLISKPAVQPAAN